MAWGFTVILAAAVALFLHAGPPSRAAAAVPPNPRSPDSPLYPRALAAYLLRQRLSLVSRDGLTLDDCTTNADCVSPRQCYGLNADKKLRPCTSLPAGTFCICRPDTVVLCNSSADCPTGEVCVILSDVKTPICASRKAAEENSFLVPVNASASPGATAAPAGSASAAPTPTPRSSASSASPQPSNLPTASSPASTPVVSTAPSAAGSPSVSPRESIFGSGLTYEPCHDDDNCTGDRRCWEYYRDNDGEIKQRLCAGASSCLCMFDDFLMCTSTAECPDGDVCAKLKSSSKSICLSPEWVDRHENWMRASVTPSPAPSASNFPSPPVVPSPASTCVDAEALRGFDRKDLVFANHSEATVLCDEKGSCATPGHMVVYKGKPMMMNTYCDVVGCTRERMLVNSPRYRRGLVVISKTDSLLFTAFAARYESRLEEMVMTASIRIGF